MEDMQNIDNTSNEVSEKNIINVGDEFMKWAEQYWAIDKIITNGLNNSNDGESCKYSYMREIFVKKINEINICQNGKV